MKQRARVPVNCLILSKVFEERKRKAAGGGVKRVFLDFQTW
jgi:hypothetical protein